MWSSPFMCGARSWVPMRSNRSPFAQLSFAGVAEACRDSKPFERNEIIAFKFFFRWCALIAKEFSFIFHRLLGSRTVLVESVFFFSFVSSSFRIRLLQVCHRFSVEFPFQVICAFRVLLSSDFRMELKKNKFVWEIKSKPVISFP